MCFVALALWGTQAAGVAYRPEAALEQALGADEHGSLATFYRAHGYRPLWFQGGRARPETVQALAALETANQDGLNPARYRVGELRQAFLAAEGGDPSDIARAEIMMSHAFAAYAEDLRNPFVGVQWAVADPRLAFSPITARAALESAAAAPSLPAHLADIKHLNPIYEALRRGLRAYRARWSGLPDVAVPAGGSLSTGSSGERVRLLRRRLGLDDTSDRYDVPLARAVRSFQEAHGIRASGAADPVTVEALNAGPGRYERVILANLERARALPPSLGRRYVLVDTAAGRLTMHEDHHVVGAMRVIVGEPTKPTPAMAGMISQVVYRPYWNVPEDLVRDRIAPRVLRHSPEALRAMQMEVLSDWSGSARLIDVESVDWSAVAAGRSTARVRQRPGPDNMLGDVKFVFLNDFDIYLHDTPDDQAFARERHTLSAGCVRVEQPAKLASFLLGTSPDKFASAEPEQRVDLPAPVPVYIMYRTASVGNDGSIVFQPDVYGRDPDLIAQLALARG